MKSAGWLPEAKAYYVRVLDRFTELKRNRELEEDAENDFEIAEILKDTNGDPDLINKKVRTLRS